MVIEWVSFALVAVAALALGAALASHPDLRTIANLVIAGAAMRIVGVFARYTMIFDLYGNGDASGYFSAGRSIAAGLHRLDFSGFLPAQAGDRVWGTQALRDITGIVIAVVGPSLRGAFLVFSLAAFLGLVCVVIACARAGAPGSLRPAALLLFFWPTLWFWPSSIGKEAILVLAVGLATLGYVGRGGRIQWVPLVAGLGLALAIRPHVAGVLAFGVLVAEWTARKNTTREVVQVLLVSVVSVSLVVMALRVMGFTSADPQDFEAFVLQTARQTNAGGSAFDRSGGMAAAIPMAFVNTLLRPFVIEANNPMVLVSSLEMMAFWGLAFARRRHLASLLRSWQGNRLLRLMVPFALFYTLMIGVTFQNFGIIARQRSLIMPALLVMVGAVPALERRRRPVPHARPAWKRDPPARPLQPAGPDA